MKKLFIAALLTVAIATTSMANPRIENAWLSARFRSEYPEARNISWSTNNSYITVSFTLNGQKRQVFYTTDGEKLAISHSIQLQELPARALRIIKNDYAGYAATEAIEFDHTEAGLHYYVSLQNSQKKIVLEITPLGEVSEFKKEKL